MIEYLTDLFQDVCDMGWQPAKGAHLVVMSKMEDGLVTWADLKKVRPMSGPVWEQVAPIIQISTQVQFQERASGSQALFLARSSMREGAQRHSTTM